MWGRFSGAEMRRRRALTDALMDEHDLDALVLFGNSGVNRHNQANVFWLTNHLDLHPCYLVLPREGKPLLLIGLANHVPSAREVSEFRFERNMALVLQPNPTTPDGRMGF